MKTLKIDGLKGVFTIPTENDIYTHKEWTILEKKLKSYGMTEELISLIPRVIHD